MDYDVHTKSGYKSLIGYEQQLSHSHTDHMILKFHDVIKCPELEFQ